MPSVRRVLHVSALVAAVVVAYVGGVVTGVVSRSDPPRPPGVIDEAAERIAADAARPVDPEALERAAVEGMLRTLGDRWSAYYRAGEFTSFQDSLEGRYSGVGVWLRPGPDGGVVVGSVQPRSPAALADLQPGDALLRVARRDVSQEDVVAVAASLRGKPESTVALVVRRGAATISLSLTREPLTTDDVTVERLRGDISRVRISAFTRGVGREVRTALRTNGQRHRGGVVLDLRDSPGGLLDEAVEVASVFLDGGAVVSYERRGRAPRTLDAAPGGDMATPVVVLVSATTASAAEVVAAALQDRNRAVVVGSQTFGKGSVQEPSRLSDGSAIELTVGRYLTPTGRAIDGVGVEPDVLVPDTQSGALAERRAVEVLSGLLAAVDGAGRG